MVWIGLWYELTGFWLDFERLVVGSDMILIGFRLDFDRLVVGFDRVFDRIVIRLL